METSMFTRRSIWVASASGLIAAVAMSATFDTPLPLTLSVAAVAAVIGLVIPFQVTNGLFSASMGSTKSRELGAIWALSFGLILLPLVFYSMGFGFDGPAGFELLVFLTALSAFLLGNTAASLNEAQIQRTTGSITGHKIFSKSSIVGAVLFSTIGGWAISAFLEPALSVSLLIGGCLFVTGFLARLVLLDQRFGPNVEHLQPVWGLAFLTVFFVVFVGIGSVGLHPSTSWSLGLMTLLTGSASYALGTAMEVLRQLET